ncbi:protein LNK1-like [Lolium rigidum]|uniref:protein LNK1-like n=1 Tax=Lolium rigidum TaxID=89674 RepID=UPI001F5CE8B7|nr:protein LNK1-like [Lolium rigidum]
MHAPVVGRRGGFFQPRDEVSHLAIGDFALSNDHAMPLFQGRDKSKMYPANPGPLLQGVGAARNSTAVYGGGTAADVVSHGKGNFCAQIQNKDVAVTMSAEAGLFPAGIGNVSDIICSPPQGDTVRSQDEHRNKGGDLFLFDWPELAPLEGVETELRKLGSPFELGGNNYFDDPMWPSICSPDAQLVPSIRFDNDLNPSTVASKSAAYPILIDLTVPDTTDQINMATPMNTQQPSKNKEKESPLNRSSSEEIQHFPRVSDADLLCPFDDMLVSTSSSTMYRNDEMIPSSATARSWPDDVASAYAPQSSTKKKKKPHATTPDMFLDEMSENPLEMYFPQVKQPQMHHQLLPEVCFAGDGAGLNSSGLELGSKGRGCSGGLRESPLPSSIAKAAPVKNLRFQKLQEGMNQLDVGTKTCIRDALYRLANNVEQRHCVDQNVGSSSAASRQVIKTSSVWTETQGSPMDRSVAQLLLQKPLYRKTTGRQANRVA